MGHWGPLNALVYRQARSRGVPHVVCPAGALPIFGRSRLLKRAYNRLVGRAMVRDAAGHIAVSRDELAHFEDYGVSAERVRIIPNGVLPSEYEHRDDAGFRRRFDLGDAPLLLFIGRLSPIKGPDLLVKAFASGRRAPQGAIRRDRRAAGKVGRIYTFGARIQLAASDALGSLLHRTSLRSAKRTPPLRNSRIGV
jgi:glycosyltransferase involved in cell wall biosynthesis